MQGMRLGGIDPSILRELSGVYKPFVKAFKELISNAFDADASSVSVKFEDDFSAVTVVDNGAGMMPFEFRNEFTRIGGGSRRRSERTRGGRLSIAGSPCGCAAWRSHVETAPPDVAMPAFTRERLGLRKSVRPGHSTEDRRAYRQSDLRRS
jgi:hypothetical protein